MADTETVLDLRKKDDSTEIIRPIINSDCIPRDAVTTEKIRNGAIISDKIENNAVTTDKIFNGAITQEKISAGAINNDKIANGTLTPSKFNSSNITSGSVIATTDYVDEHGGGGGGRTLYKHFIHLTFLDGCSGDYAIDGYVVLESTSNAQFTATTFKALFNSADIEVGSTNYKIMTILSNQYYKQEWEDLKVCCYKYDSTEDCFSNECGTYSGSLTLDTISDTVASV